MELTWVWYTKLIACVIFSDYLKYKNTGNVLIDVILRHDPATIVAVETNECCIFSVGVCSLTYTTCNAHEPYYIVIYGLFLCAMFFHIIS
jgi:hypothetical protein